ncbi:hypothetical protein IAC76_01505 [Spirochaetes bacterium]|uniref:SnoaL-like domain-containing protein n=1 Tax=Candidatus Scatousia excrementipullorum TaxID=2840936 RepID=A0A9D9GYR9_9BACT|nr:hypothetical protein [Candidatus Scatousia excrementipullorum]
MKRILFFVTLLSVLVLNVPQYAQAGIIADYKARVSESRQIKNTEKEIREVFKTQDKYTNSYDFDGLYRLYSDDFMNCDGYNKEVYFKLIKETWETYPEITYQTEIVNVNVTSNFATVETFETAFAVTEEDSEYISAVGELRSEAHCIYHLKRDKGRWLISGEDILDERSSLKYGDARFIKMELNAPTLIGAGQDYSAELKVDMPADQIVIASIASEKIIQPVEPAPERYRKLPSDQILERLFVANKDNVNEYSIASVGVTRTEPLDEENVKVYMNGLAFLMTRVNVVPKNNFIKMDEKPAVKDVKGGETK